MFPTVVIHVYIRASLFKKKKCRNIYLRKPNGEEYGIGKMLCLRQLWLFLFRLENLSPDSQSVFKSFH